MKTEMMLPDPDYTRTSPAAHRLYDGNLPLCLVHRSGFNRRRPVL